MSHCVLTNTNEFKNLYNQIFDEVSSKNKIILAAKISLWQEKNGLDNFPDLNNLNNDNFENNLERNNFDDLSNDISLEQTTDTGEIIENIKNKLNLAIQIYSKDPKAKPLVEDLSIIKSQLDTNLNEQLSLFTFVKETSSYLDKAYRKFFYFKKLISDKKLKNENLSKEELETYSREFNEIRELIHLYESLDSINLLISNPDYIFENFNVEELKSILSKSLYNKDIIKRDLKNYMLDLATEFLYKQAESTNEKFEGTEKEEKILTKKEIKNSLIMASEDISLQSATFEAAISSSDAVISLTARSLKEAIREAEIKDFNVYENLAKVFEKLLPEIQKVGDSYFNKYLRDVEVRKRIFNKEKNEYEYKKIKSKAIISEFNIDEFEDEKSKMFEKAEIVLDKYGDSFYAEYIDNWFSNNKPLKENAFEIFSDKKENLTPSQYRTWVYDNTIPIKSGLALDKLSKENRVFVYENTFKKDKNGKNVIEYRRAKSDSELVTFAKKYQNLDFEKLYNNDTLFKELHDLYKSANSKLPFNNRLKYNLIPQLSKNPNKSIKQKLEGLKDRWKEEEEKYYDVGLDGKKKRTISSGMNGTIENLNDLNTNLIETILAYSQMANKYEALYNVEDTINLIQALITDDPTVGIEARKIADVSAKGMIIKDKITGIIRTKEISNRVNEVLNNFINDVMYGESEIIENFAGLNLNKIGSDIGFLTAMQTMALNFNGGFISNKIQGNILGNYKEAVGGKFFNQQDYHEADLEYKKSTSKFLDDFRTNKPIKSKYNRLNMRFDSIQGDFRDSYGQKVTATLANRLFSRNTLFFLNHTAEHQIQTTSMIAVMKGFKLSNGKSLFDAFDDFGELKNEYKTIVTKDIEKQFTFKLHAINKMLHGNYNDFDKAAIQRKWWGKQMMMFRKYLPTAISSRFGKEFVNYELGDVQEGYYRSFSKSLVKDFKEFGINSFPMLLKRFAYTSTKTLTGGKLVAFKDTAKGSLTDDQFYYYVKTLYDVTWLLVASALIGGLSQLDLDDDDKFAVNYTKLQIIRFKKDVEQFIPPLGFNDLLKTLQSPAASINILIKYGDFISQMVTPFEKYRASTGWADKGDYKIAVKFQKLIPVWRQIISIMTPEEQIKFYNK